VVAEKALSPIRRRVHGTTKLPDDEARSAGRAGTSATGASKSEFDVFWRVSKQRLADQQAQLELDPLCATAWLCAE